MLFLKIKLKRLLKKALNNKTRYKHSINAANLAYKLAKKHNVDKNLAYLSALFHDFSKYFNKDQYLAYLSYEEYNKNKDFIQLFHGPVSAYYVYYFLKNDSDCFNSIYYHTVVCKDMSDLAKIVFIADKAEKQRKYKEVEPIRKEMFFNLDYAFLLALEADLLYLKKNKIKPIETQTDTYNYYKELVWKKYQ